MKPANPELEKITQRLRELENRHARMKRGTVWILGLLALVVLSGQARPRRPRTVRAREFRLVDQQGNSRAVLRMLDTGPALLLKSQDEETRGGMALVSDNAQFVVFDERVSVDSETGNPQLGPDTSP